MNRISVLRGANSSLLGRLSQSQVFWAYLFLLPTLIGIGLFSIGAMLAVTGMTFTEWDILSPPRWSGFANYQKMFGDPLFWKSLGNTFYYTAGVVPVSMLIPFVLALALNKKIKGIVAYRTIYFLPVVSSIVAIAFLWSWLYNPQFGLFNWILDTLHLPTSSWISSTRWAMPSVIMMSVWKNLGYNMVVFLAGLQGMPKVYYEAATIDGASRWQMLWKITIPLMSPVIFFVLILTLISSFQVFEQTYVLTEGGPANATLTFVYYIFLQAFYWFRMSYAATMALVLFTIMFILTSFQVILQRRWVHY